MEVVLRCENDVEVDALTVVDFTMFIWFVSHLTVGETRLLSSRVVINSLTFELTVMISDKGRNSIAAVV